MKLNKDDKVEWYTNKQLHKGEIESFSSFGQTPLAIVIEENGNKVGVYTGILKKQKRAGKM